MTPAAILKVSYPPDVVDALLAAYIEIESNFALGKWKASELDAGHFVEAARRMLEVKLFGAHTPIGNSLSNFNDGEFRRYEQAIAHDDEFRILIPRVLKSIYGIRNKRNVAHIGKVSPNEMDATLILYSVKWVLAEFLRQTSGMSVADTQQAVDSIIERRLSLLWKHDGVTRVLHSIGTREQVLVLLYDENSQDAEKLRSAIEYKNASDFRKILRKLHAERLIEFSANATCTISPIGIIEAERIIRHVENEPAPKKATGARPRRR
jgi:hypothetical protein